MITDNCLLFTVLKNRVDVNFLPAFYHGVSGRSIYALCTRMTLIYKCSGVLNLGMGELTHRAYVCLSFTIGVPFVLALFFTLLVGFMSRHADGAYLSPPMVGGTAVSVDHGDGGAFLLFQVWSSCFGERTRWSHALYFVERSFSGEGVVGPGLSGASVAP